LGDEMTDRKINVCVLGASGYTGSDFIRLAARHTHINITALTAHSHAGKAMAEVFPHLSTLDLPRLTTVEEVDFSTVDAVVCGLPHGTTQKIISELPETVKIIDMSADFRLRNALIYEQTYGQPHQAQELQKSAAYGLSELNREDIRNTRLVACPGCYPTAALLVLSPLLAGGVISGDDIIIDAKSGVTGAGRGLKQNTLFSEAGEGMSAYSVAVHRHAPEIEQELSKASGGDIVVNFTPHLVPMSRGELVTCHVRLEQGASADDLRQTLQSQYEAEPFVSILPQNTVPATQNVRGSNHCQIGVFADRIPGRAIVIGVIDNLVKGSAGQALQNLNLMFGIDETTGLEQLPMFP
jgi:N-acetyl-gamma-glutamyl-phosphate reductase